jgi:shikimate kinase
VARELADVLGGVCVDTDELVSEQAGKSIAAIFAEEGEAGFRRRECDIIAQVGRTTPTVISVGGGAILDERNVEALRRVATLVWLTASADVLFRRISSDPTTVASRPPLVRPSLVRDSLVRDSNLAPVAALGEIEHLLAERSPLYQRAADFTVDTTDMSPRQVAEVIVARLNRTRQE